MLGLIVFKVLASSFRGRLCEISLCCCHPLGYDVGVVLYVVCHVVHMFIDAWISHFEVSACMCGEMVRASVWSVVRLGLLAQVEVARGSQRLSMDRFWEDVHHLFCAIRYFGVFLSKKGFVHHGCSVALQLLCSMCWTWSRQRRRRGRRPHDVHVRCFEVHGTIHMMAAKSATWSYLKRAWDNDLTFERASRSIAKTGLC